MQVVQLLGGAGRAALRCSMRARAPRARGPVRRGARRSVRGVIAEDAAARPSPTCSRRTAGCSRASRWPCAVERRRARDRAPPPGGVARAGTDRGARPQISLDYLSAGRARGRGARRGARSRPAARAYPTPSDHFGSVVVDVPALRVCALYPELMNIYADRGNIAVLRARCEWRGLGFELAAAEPRRAGSTPAPTTSSTWAAARTATRSAVADDMAETKRDALHAAADRGAVVLAVCGGYQLLGHSYELGDEELPGRRPRGPAHRARARPAPDRQLRHRGRPRRPARA